MAVDLMRFSKMEDQTAIEEAASQGIKSMEHLIRVMSSQSHRNNNNNNYTDLTDVTVSNFKKVISLLNRTGHARFRRAPVRLNSCGSSNNSPPRPPPPPPSSFSVSRSQPQNLTLSLTSNPPPPPPDAVAVQPATAAPAPASFGQSQKQQSVTLDFTKRSMFSSGCGGKGGEIEFSVSSASSFMSSAITGDESVSNGKLGSSIFLAPAAAATVSCGKPPSAPYNKKRCHEHDLSDDLSGKISSGKCHCSKKR